MDSEASSVSESGWAMSAVSAEGPCRRLEVREPSHKPSHSPEVLTLATPTKSLLPPKVAHS